MEPTVTVPLESNPILEPLPEIELFTYHSVQYRCLANEFHNINKITDEYRWNYSKEERAKYNDDIDKYFLERGATRYRQGLEYVWRDCIDVVGCFKVKYKRYTCGVFGVHGRVDHSDNEAEFYQDDNLLFKRTLRGNMFVLYGDGKTLENTYYTYGTHKDVTVYNLKNEVIYVTSIGFDCQK